MRTKSNSTKLLGPVLAFVALAILTPQTSSAISETSCHARCANGDCWCILCNCGCSTGVVVPNDPWCGERRATVTHTYQNVGVYVRSFVGDAGEILLSSNSVVRQASHGGVSVQSGGAFYYSPNPGFTGQDSFTFRICNFYSQCDLGTALIDVVP